MRFSRDRQQAFAIDNGKVKDGLMEPLGQQWKLPHARNTSEAHHECRPIGDHDDDDDGDDDCDDEKTVMMIARPQMFCSSATLASAFPNAQCLKPSGH